MCESAHETARAADRHDRVRPAGAGAGRPDAGSRPSATPGRRRRTRSPRSWRTWRSGRTGSAAGSMASTSRWSAPRRSAGPSPRRAAWEDLKAHFLVGPGARGRARSLRIQLDRPVAPAIEFPPLMHYTTRDALVHVAHHNAYHLGQIVSLRQAMGLWPPAGRRVDVVSHRRRHGATPSQPVTDDSEQTVTDRRGRTRITLISPSRMTRTTRNEQRIIRVDPCIP